MANALLCAQGWKPVRNRCPRKSSVILTTDEVVRRVWPLAVSPWAQLPQASQQASPGLFYSWPREHSLQAEEEQSESCVFEAPSGSSHWKAGRRGEAADGAVTMECVCVLGG